VSSFVFKAKGRVVLFFSEITDRTQAEALKGLSLYLLKKDLPDLEEGAFYTYALIGCSVFSASGNKIGVVLDVANFGAGDLLEITEDASLHSADVSRFWVPFHEAFVHTVDTQKKEVHVADDILALFGPEALSCKLQS
jgi:16S rRNA processing protein RimM